MEANAYWTCSGVYSDWPFGQAIHNPKRVSFPKTIRWLLSTSYNSDSYFDMQKTLLLTLCLFCSIYSTPAHSQAFADVQAAYTGVDPFLPELDVYLSIAGVDAGKVEDVESGGDAAPFLPVLAGVTVDLGIALGSSTSRAEAFKTVQATFGANKAYYMVLSGLQDPASFAPNPDGRDISLNLFSFDEARVEGSENDKLDVIFFHGSTDTPAIDIEIRGGVTLAENLSYGDFSSYTSLAQGTYTIDVFASGTDDPIASFLATNIFPGEAAIVGLLGFSSPESNQDGEPLGMVALFPSTVAVPLEPTDPPVVGTDIDEDSGALPISFKVAQNYPNPFSERTSITFSIPAPSQVSLEIYNLQGQLIARPVESSFLAGRHMVEFDAGHLSPGVYFYTLSAGGSHETRKMVIVRRQ